MRLLATARDRTSANTGLRLIMALNYGGQGEIVRAARALATDAAAGLIAPDKTTFDYIRGKEFAPKGEALEQAIAYWQSLKSDEGAHFDAEVVLDAADINRLVTALNRTQILNARAALSTAIATVLAGIRLALS